MSNPVSAAIDWTTWATASVSAPFGTMKSTLTGGVTPASFNSALAFSTLRGGSEKPSGNRDDRG